MKVFLIGMPGCGKSTFGKRAADKLNMMFIDLDKEIENFSGKSILEIFEDEGEAWFRDTESTLLRKITLENDSFIMATGGGAPCFYDNIMFMNENGTTFYIQVEIEHLLNRLSEKGINKRPLLKKMGEENLEKGLQEKLEARDPFYSQASFTIQYHDSLENDIIFYVKSKT